MAGVRLGVNGPAGELAAVATATEDDFMYFRDSVCVGLEAGSFGSVYPVFQNHFFSDWEAGVVAALEAELVAMHAAMRAMPPEPFDGNWRAKLIRSGRTPETLAEVFVDKDGAPLVEGLIRVVRAARENGLPVSWT